MSPATSIATHAPKLALGKKSFRGRRCMHDDVINVNDGTRTGMACKKCGRFFPDEPAISKLVKGEL